MPHTAIRADQVKPGDRVYNSLAFHPSAAWSLVTYVESCQGHTVIKTPGYDTWKHPAEAVAVLRGVSAQNRPKI